MTQASSLAAAVSYIETLDLNYIILKMCAANYPLPQWTREDALRCSQLYKNFLILNKKYLPQPLVPTREIDEFWHNHILHTRRYLQDCQQIFGYYLHHEPTDEATDDGTLLRNNYLKTKELYYKEFGKQLQINPLTATTL